MAKHRNKPPRLRPNDLLRMHEKAGFVVHTHDPSTENALFVELCGPVRPLKAAKPRVAPKPPRCRPTSFPTTTHAPQTPEPTPATHAYQDLHPHHTYGGRHDVDPRRHRQLRRGDIRYRLRLDLHGYTSERAHQALEALLHQALQQGERCVLVITGQGKSSPQGVAVLRNLLPEWLTHPPLCHHVLAFSSATPKDGGNGAFYVLLRRHTRSFGARRTVL